MPKMHAPSRYFASIIVCLYILIPQIINSKETKNRKFTILLPLVDGGLRSDFLLLFVIIVTRGRSLVISNIDKRYVIICHFRFGCSESRFQMPQKFFNFTRSNIAVTTESTGIFQTLNTQNHPKTHSKTSENHKPNTSIFAKRIIHNKYTVVLYV